ncbi:MAG: hypothetical protein UDG86_05010 [Lachnospiraceae bacterium]|nr:hypothetical protein [Lachnospiraceae bacterium]
MEGNLGACEVKGGEEIIGSSYVGGLAGKVTNRMKGGKVSGVGSVTGGDYTGGLCGEVSQAVAGRAEEIGSITGGNYTGGLAGRAGTIGKSFAEGIGNVTGKEYTGGLVGCASGEVSESHASGKGKVTSGTSKYAGGLAGRMEKGGRACYATVNVEGSSYVGGLTGEVNGKVLEQSYATGNVSTNGTAGILGGLAGSGRIIGYSSALVIKNCFATGAVADRRNTGGILGDAYNTEIRNCYSLSGNGNGLGAGSITRSYFNGDLAGEESADLTGRKTTEELKLQETYEGWDFETVWEMEEGGYPTLRIIK